ncbi:NLR family CARD domain-containing protein 4-like [Ptychodera flava]|uniref:NLR family CARD domain-containing protein 4-like n=1 Tax=Ptychodera flava TaxID=63121 RepID=UPI00396A8822
MGTSSDPIGSGNEAAQSNAQHNTDPIPSQLACESPIDPFTVMLFKLSQDISNDKLKNLKRLCKGPKMLTKSELEPLKNPYDLFDNLRSKGLIHEKDTRLVHYLLQIIGLNALVEKHIKPSANPGTLTNKTATLVKHLKDKYKRHYSKLLPIPWNDDICLSLEEVYTTLEVKEMKKGGLKTGTTLENFHDVFKSLDNRRIRIEGAPAMGKSTLCRKLAYDWSCGELQQYTLLFFLEMRHIAKNNMIDEILNQLIPGDFELSKEEISEVVSMNIVSVLFLCDGLDEPDEHKVTNSEIPKLISENLYSWCTAVVTTRPYLCNRYLNKCDSHLLVKGFTSKRKDEYILKYFKDDIETGNSLIKQIKHQEESNELTEDLFENPLHVSFLCILWEYHKAKRYYFPETLTKLYSEILECILKRYCEKNNIELKNDEIPENVLCDRDTLASDSFNAYREGKTNFDRSEISSEATLNFGLLVKDLGHAMRKSEQIYFFYHMTWLEYFTALHLTSQLRSNNTKTLTKFLKHPKKHLQILKFVAGIVTKEEGKLFFDELNKKLKNLYEEVLSLKLGCRDMEEVLQSPLGLYGDFIKFVLESKYPEDFITCLNALSKGTIVYSHISNTSESYSIPYFLCGFELQNVIRLDRTCLSFQDFLLTLQLISKTYITFDNLHVHGLEDNIKSCLEVLKENPI